MSYLIAVPDMMTTAAADLAAIGSDLSAARTTAAGSTVAVTPAAADEVSASVAQLFSSYAGDYHALAGQASVFHDQFTQNLKAGTGSYASAESTIVSILQGLTNTVASDWRALLDTLPPGLQQAYSLLQPLVEIPLFFGIFFAAYLYASLEVAIEQLLAKFGL